MSHTGNIPQRESPRMCQCITCTSVRMFTFHPSVPLFLLVFGCVGLLSAAIGGLAFREWPFGTPLIGALGLAAWAVEK